MLGWYSVVRVPPWVRWFYLQGLYADLGYKAPLMHLISMEGEALRQDRVPGRIEMVFLIYNGLLGMAEGRGAGPSSPLKAPTWAFNTHASEGQGSALGNGWDCQKDATRRGRGDTWRLEGSPRHLAGLLVAVPALVLGQ